MAATRARRLATPSSVNAAVKQIADVMRRANCAGALQMPGERVAPVGHAAPS